MSTSFSKSSRAAARRQLQGRLLAAAVTFLATLAAAPGYAVIIPNVPLQSQAEYPPANVRFILDDSGSMNLIAMPAALSDDKYDSGTGASGDLDDRQIKHASYGHNTIYYNPATVYKPWIKSDGTRFTDGTSYTHAYRHTALLSDEVDLSESTKTYYVPKSDAVLTSTDAGDFHRYQIRWVNRELRVVRSEWGKLSSKNRGESNAGCAGGNNGDDGWRECTFATPVTGRDEATEMANFATWYSYHRSRMKVAKAGASEALSRVGEKLRIGLDTINRNTTGIPYDIPVGSDEGLFRGANKDTWFARLQAARGNNSTPLHRALQRAGDYFSQTGTAGPWGPQAGTAQISCRQNFAILTTDGFWNSTDDYTSVGDADGTDGATILRPEGSAKDDYTYKPANPYRDNFVETAEKSRGDTLADVAMHYWKRDLRADLENNVPESFADPSFWQHMVTFGVSIGLKGRLDPKNDFDSIKNGTKHWPDPINGGENADRIDDLWHASVNGRGGFLVASNTKEFTEGLLQAFATVAERLGSASNVTANSTSFITNTRVYQASYVSGQWSGELAAYDASPTGVSDTPTWKASSLMPTSGRTFVTWDGSAGVAFPTAAQASLLNQSTRPVAPVGSADNVAYLKGERSQERQNKGQLRDRTSVLGDIVNSSPMYVKDTETIFVGANDGMLHAFDALTGVERFAYVPAGIDFAKLATLSSPQYSHEYFVDGPIVVSTRSVTADKNYLIGTLGRGGKGVYALDVTDPTRFRTSDVLWERNSGANMGYVLGEPMIATLNNGTVVAIFGNGINSASGKAVLFVVNLATGALLQEIDTGVAGDNGLSSPRGWDEDGNGTVDYVFAGDLKGNVWKFDFRTGGTGSIAFSGRPFFTAPSGQPITADLALAGDPVTGKRWVFAGTGSLMTKADLTDNSIQSMYGLIDDNSDVIAKSELQERTIAVVDTATGNRGFEPADTLPAGKRGWYLDLAKPVAGERVVNRPLIDGTALFFASVIPPTSNACDAGGKGYLNALDAFTGTSLQAPFFDSNGDGVFDDKDTLTHGSGKVVVGSMDPGIGMLTKPIIIRGPGRAIAVVGGSQGGKADPPINPPGTAPHRVSWREILRD
ncbi:pilus assembly protein [Lysobacter solisilvae (ex Woo and Kim 2022)]|uniref:Pilus assembly protein n=1 Tax=Agrilutibacter terrestris TaxID=2865112 RepID=A0A7H0FY39_9GAMM|nr:PilC/PilY family type IV pilus protein [Lysobacter terrestris]QNP40955.1 pilus assembly protein [Lysobacter terrestris]